MYKKISMIVILFVIFYLMLSPKALSNEITDKENNKGLSLKTFFAASPLITIEYERIEESVIPNFGVIEIPFKTSLSLVGVFADWQARKLENFVIVIELSILDKPDWCDASITNPLVLLNLDHTEPFISTLSVTVDENAPAFTLGKVEVKATSQEISGLFFTRIIGEEVTFDIPFEVGYLSIINIETEEAFMEIPPLNVTNIPIKLENYGNGPTYVRIEIEDIPGWNFTFPTNVAMGSPALREENEIEFDIEVKPPKYFSSETINITFTPSYLGSPDLQGEPTILNIVLKNDGSLKEGGSDITLLIIIFVAIVIIILISIFIKRNFFNK